VKSLKHLTDKPWERKGIIGGLKPEGVFDTAAEKVALGFFLVVATVLFSLFTISYFIRMELPDWRPLAEPAQLWFNTGLLLLSSVLFQLARNKVSRGEARNVFTLYLAGGIAAFLFIGGQLMVWNGLLEAGVYLTPNPAASFYYLLTGVHAAHLLGGLWVWSKTSIRLVSGAEPKDVRLSIELCTLYWHFLLVVWLVMFAVLSNT